MKKTITLFLVTLCTLCLISCSENSATQFATQQEILNRVTTQPYNTVITNETPLSLFYEIRLYENSKPKTLEEVNKVLEIQCLREYNDELYCIYKLKTYDGLQYGLGYMFFEYNKDSQNWEQHRSYTVKFSQAKNDYSSLKVGDSLSKLAEIDAESYQTVRKALGGGVETESISFGGSISKSFLVNCFTADGILQIEFSCKYEAHDNNDITDEDITIKNIILSDLPFLAQDYPQ